MRVTAMRSAHGTNTASRLGLALLARVEGDFTTKPDQGVCSPCQDIFPGVSLEDIGISPASDGKLVGSGAIAVSKTGLVS
jgi:hypothetical protein